MADPASVSAARSSVYRRLFSEHDPSSESLQRYERAEQSGDFINSVNKWTFLHKLLEIEKTHDCKKLERLSALKEEELARSKKPVCVELGDMIVDSTAGSTRAQVLEETGEESLCAEHRSLHQDSQPLIPNSSIHQNFLPHIHNSSGSKTQQELQRGLNKQASSDGGLHEHSETSAKMCKPQSSSIDDPTSDRQVSESSSLSALVVSNRNSTRDRKRNQLRLPPVMLPRVYTLTPRPLQYRQFLTPTKIRGPIMDEEWEELKHCRYLRHVMSRYTVT